MAKKAKAAGKKPTKQSKKPTNPPAVPAGPSAEPAGPGATGLAGLGPGVTLPQGITIQRPTPSFSPDLQQALEAARKSHGYYVTVTEADQSGNLRTKSFRGGGYDPDWLLRANRLALAHILDGELVPTPKGGA